MSTNFRVSIDGGAKLYEQPLNLFQSSVTFDKTGTVPIQVEIKLRGEPVAEFEKALNGYLNTRPDAPKWLFDLADQIRPIKEPDHA